MIIMPTCQDREDEFRVLFNETLKSMRGQHQREGLTWMFKRETRPGVVPVTGGILADEMGLGKTHQMCGLLRLRPIQTLIVTTLATLVQWQEVLSSTTRINPFILRGKDQADLLGAQGFDQAKIVLTTYSVFRKGPESVPKALDRDWGRVVLDEAHVVRNHKANTYRAICKLRAAHRWAITGTPVNNNIQDLEALVSWLGTPCLDLSLVRNHLILRRTKEVEGSRSPEFTMPTLSIDDCVVVMGDEERRLYDLIESSGRVHAMIGQTNCVASTLQPASLVPGGEVGLNPTFCMSSVRVMEAILRCRQACTHVALMCVAVQKACETRSTPRMPLQDAMCDPSLIREACRYPPSIGSSSKIRKLVEMISEHSKTEKSIVFCDWIMEMELIATSLTNEVGVSVVMYKGSMDLAQRDHAIRSFNSMEDGAVMLLQIQCGGTGLNIQAASRVYLMRPSWNPCVEQQAISRAHRLGQLRPVIVKRLVCENTIDERCILIQSKKLLVIQSVMESVVAKKSVLQLEDVHALLSSDKPLNTLKRARTCV